MRVSFVFLLAALPIAAAQAADYRVGGDGSCTHGTIQAAVNAAESNPGADFIRVSRSASYTAQTITINTSQTLTLFGGYADCFTDFGDTTATVVDGGGGSANSVFRIGGGSTGIVRLSGLIIRNGDASPLNGEGGGIYFNGSGRLELANLSIINSTARRGGGIYANGGNELAQLVIGTNVTISGNTAVGDGGGVFVNGMRVEMAEPNSIIAFNEALGQAGDTGYGGGLVVRSTGTRSAVARISSPGVGALGAIYGNEAKRGGGVAVSAGSDADAYATLELFSTYDTAPGAIRGNFASEMGGGIYVWPNVGGFDTGFADAVVRRGEITGNAAPEGAAVYLDNSNVGGLSPIGGNLDVNRQGIANALPCPATGICSLIADNVAEDAAGTDTDGALIYGKADAVTSIGAGTVITGNQVGRLFDGVSDEGVAAYFNTFDTLIHGNTTRQELIRLSGDAGTSLTDSTIAGNVVGGDKLIQANSRGEVEFKRSIVWQPGEATLNSGGGAPHAERLIASEVVSLNAGPEAIVADPRFVDPAGEDYTLKVASPAIDFAPPVVGDDRDGFGRPRDRNIDEVVPSNPLWIRDIGAYERQNLLPIVLNGDYLAAMTHWFLPPGHVGNWQVGNAPGSPTDTGMAQVAASSELPRVLGYLQCVHLPGAATYALNGYGRSSGEPLQHNPTALIWELRLDGGEGCLDGAIVASGVHRLSTSDQWTRPAQPALIPVTLGQWTHNTSLTIILAVDANPGDTQAFNGVFDNITLTTTTGPAVDTLFKDSFED